MLTSLAVIALAALAVWGLAKSMRPNLEPQFELASVRKRRLRSNQERSQRVLRDASVAVLTGTVVAASILLVDQSREEDRLNRLAALQNTTYLREASLQHEERPIPAQSLYLHSASLAGLNLSSALLSEANLSGANLREADLSGADLTKANLAGADLTRTNLEGALLVSADLSGTKLHSAVFTQADLTGADLSASEYSLTCITPPEAERECELSIDFEGAYWDPENPPRFPGWSSVHTPTNPVDTTVDYWNYSSSIRATGEPAREPATVDESIDELLAAALFRWDFDFSRDRVIEMLQRNPNVESVVRYVTEPADEDAPTSLRVILDVTSRWATSSSEEDGAWELTRAYAVFYGEDGIFHSDAWMPDFELTNSGTSYRCTGEFMSMLADALRSRPDWESEC